MTRPHNPVFTIGHSTYEMPHFIALLRKYDIQAVGDVRSAPYSRFNPQFNREPLTASLERLGIKYVYLGKKLGARSNDPSCYESGRVVYGRLARTSEFVAGIERVLRGAEDLRIALMCAEKEPLDCHRTILVAPALVARGMDVRHILEDGSLEPHASTMERLLDVVGLPREDLFRVKEELIAEAMARQEKKIAYVDENRVSHTEGNEG